MLDSEIMKEKENHHLLYADFESTLAPEDNGNQNPNESYANKYHENMLLPAMVINQYVLMINLISLSSRTYVKMLFTILLIV